jgi:hypothetical protein
MGKACAHKSNRINDNLPTPYSMTEQLMENEKFDYDKSLLEPCCGEGAVLKILKNYKIDFDCYDINGHIGSNFLYEKSKYNYIITNPPFSLWDNFVEKAKTVATEKFAFLGDMDFLTGIKRFNNKLYFDSKYGLARVYEFVRKCDLRHELRKDGRYPAGMQHYGWYIFEKGWDKDYYIGKWINNHEYILSSKDNTCKCKLCEEAKIAKK